LRWLLGKKKEKKKREKEAVIARLFASYLFQKEGGEGKGGFGFRMELLISTSLRKEKG